MNNNQAREGSEQDGAEDRFIYTIELPSLQETASYSVALGILHSHDGSYSHIINYCNKTEPKCCKENIEILKLPRLIENQIKISMKKVSRVLRVWVEHFEKELFAGPRSPYRPNQIDITWCVWLANGEIDYLKTGMKMLKSGTLSEYQKFTILSSYCMEVEIKKITSNASLNVDPNDALQNYWIRRLENQPNISTDVEMARISFSCGILAREYFWNRLSDEDRFEITRQWIELDRICNGPECAFLERSISALPRHLQHRLLALKSDVILVGVSVYSNSIRCALWVWKNCKDFLTEDQFSPMVKKIIQLWEKDHDNKNDLCPALIEMWETAHYRLINDASYYASSNSIFETCFFKHDEPSANSLEFLRRFCAQMHPSTTRSIMFAYRRRITWYFRDLDILNEIVNGCMPDPDDKLEYIKEIIGSVAIRHHFFNCIRRGKLEQLNLLLGQDIQTARALKKQFLRSVPLENTNRLFDDWDAVEWYNLERFIDESFADDESQGIKEKERFAKARNSC